MAGIAFAIESIGVAGATDRQLLFAKGRAPAWDTDNAFVGSCFVDFPSEIASTVDFFTGDSSIGSLALELFAGALTQAGDTIASILYDQIKVSSAALTATISSTDTNIQLDTTTLAGKKIVLGREVIYLTSYNATSARYESCVRGMLGTTAQKHSADSSAYRQVFLASTGPVLQWRRVTLYRYDDNATSYSDLVALWSGVITAISAPGQRIRVDLDSAISAIQGSTILARQARARDISGAAGEGILFMLTPDAIVGAVDGALMCADGDVVVELDGSTLAGEAMIFLTAPFVYRTLDTAGKTQVIPTQPKDVYQVFHASATSATSTSTLPLSRNLLTCFLQILTTKDGSNGAYDVGATAGADILGLGIPAHLVDVSTIERIRDELGDALETDTLVFGLDGKPMSVFSLFRDALRPFAVAIIDKAGKISVSALFDALYQAPTLIESTDLVGPAGSPASSPIDQSRRFDMVVDAYSIAFAATPGHDVTTDRFNNAARRQINVYGEQTAPVLRMDWYRSRDRVTQVALPLIQRFNDPLPQINVVALRSRSDIELGDLVSLTHSKVYKATGGARGVAGSLCVVIERALSLATNQLFLRLLNVGALYSRQGQIGPSAVIVSVAGTTLTVRQNVLDAALGYQSGATSSPAPYDVSSFTVGDVVDHCDTSGVVAQQLTIASISTPATIVVTTTPSPTPIAGDVIRLTSYDAATSTARDRFAWFADADGKLGAADDNGKEYSF
jgi:hypothetical protein